MSGNKLVDHEETDIHMVKNIIQHSFVGLVIGFMIISVMYVAYAISPGSIINPLFSPSLDDVSGSFGMRCNWTGAQPKLLGDDSGGDEACYWINVTCVKGSVTEIHTGGYRLSRGGSANCNPPATPW